MQDRPRLDSSRRARSLRGSLLVVTALALAAARSGRAQTIDDPKQIFGSWTITSHRSPGTSAMSAADADRWHGRKGTYSESEARLGDNSCASPSYAVHKIPEDQFKAGFRVTPGRLGLGTGPVTVIEIQCKGGEWSVPGSLLVVETKDRLLAFWDGRYFVMDRQ